MSYRTPARKELQQSGRGVGGFAGKVGAMPHQNFGPSLMALQVRDPVALEEAAQQHQRQMRRPDNPGGAGKNGPFSGAMRSLLTPGWKARLANESGNPVAFEQRTAGVRLASLEKSVHGAISRSSSGQSGDDDDDDGVDNPEWQDEEGGDSSSSSSSSGDGSVDDTLEAALFAYQVAVSPEAEKQRKSFAARLAEGAAADELESLLRDFGGTLLGLIRQGAHKAGARTGYVQPYLVLRWLSRRYYASIGGELWFLLSLGACALRAGN
jgi:hypothetical protein